jgi:SAM-dependent methyltransferase
MLGGIRRGGHRTAAWSAEHLAAHGQSIFDNISACLEDWRNKIGLEVGPGDNLEVCRLFLATGADEMFAVERYADPKPTDRRIRVIRRSIELLDLDSAVDFAYSNDAFEHVSNVSAAMKSVHRALRGGGCFVCNVDLRGHNVFNKANRPLDFLTCPDWLWHLMFSHIATTNRVRVHQLLEAAADAGFRVIGTKCLAKADADYLRRLRPHLLPRYRRLPDSDLEVLQLLLTLVKPEGEECHSKPRLPTRLA